MKRKEKKKFYQPKNCISFSKILVISRLFFLVFSHKKQGCQWGVGSKQKLNRTQKLFERNTQNLYHISNHPPLPPPKNKYFKILIMSFSYFEVLFFLISSSSWPLPLYPPSQWGGGGTASKKIIIFNASTINVLFVCVAKMTPFQRTSERCDELIRSATRISPETCSHKSS